MAKKKNLGFEIHIRIILKNKKLKLKYKFGHKVSLLKN